MTPIPVAYIDTARGIGGAEKSLLELLSHLDRAQVTPYLLHAEGARWLAEAAPEGVQTREVFRQAALLHRRRDDLGSVLANLHSACAALGAALSVRGELHRCEAQLAHTNTLKAHMIGGLGARLAGVPLVWHLRDIVPQAGAARLLERAARRFRPHVIAISDAVAAQCASWDCQVCVIYNGIPLDQFTPGPANNALRSELGVPADRPLICTVSRLTPWKGNRNLLQALALLQRRRVEFHALVVGDVAFWEDSYERELRSLCTTLGLDRRVSWCGYRRGVAEILRLSSLFVLPSEDEPFGRAIVEAMATGLPVVACARGGVPEIVDAGSTGLLVEPGEPEQLADAMARLLAEESAAREMGERGRQRAVAMFDVTRVARQVQELYTRLLGGS